MSGLSNRKDPSSEGDETVPLRQVFSGGSESTPEDGTRFLSAKEHTDDSLSLADREEKKRGQFAAKTDYILSLVGYSVGLANIWRFPYLCYQNGGGAFLFPYMICLILCGVPLFFMEVSIGQFTSRSSATMWSICPWLKGVGWASVVVSILCSWYFNVLLGYAVFFFSQSFTLSDLPWSSCGNWWNTPLCLDYKNKTFADEFREFSDWKRNNSPLELYKDHFDYYNNKTWKSASEEYFNNRVLQISSGIDTLGGLVWGLVPCVFIGWLCTFVCLIKGVQSSGKAVYFTATFPYILLTILLIKGATLEGAGQGIMFYISPNFTYLLKPKAWADAAFQVFFSLGPGWGGLVTMGSYNTFHNNVYKDSMYLPLVMELTSVYAGFVVFSVLGFMSHKMGKPITEVVQEGPALFFITYPEIVTMLPLSQLWSALFFFMVLIVGLDTEFVMIETAITAIYDEMPIRFRDKIKRVWILTGTCILLFLFGLVFVSRGGAYVLYLVDQYSSFYTLMVVCILELMSVGWIYGAERFLSDIEFMIGKRPGVLWSICWRFMTGTIVFIILILAIKEFITKDLKYGDYSYPKWASWGLALAIILLSLIIIPIYMLWYYWQLKGSVVSQSENLPEYQSYALTIWNNFKMKMVQCNYPTKLWGPANPEKRSQWILYQQRPEYDPGFIGQFRKHKMVKRISRRLQSIK